MVVPHSGELSFNIRSLNLSRGSKSMKRFVAVAMLLVILMEARGVGQTREEKVRNDKARVEADGYWMYNDLPGALAEGKRTGKPVVVVLRCLPCEECVKLDDEVIDADERVKGLLDQFVRVRIVGTNGLDLELLQFDTDQSFAVFLLNGDGTIYGRFGTRSDRTEWIGDVSIDGFAQALQGALELHRDYPQNKEMLVAKRGPQPDFATPEQYPALASRYKSTLDYQGKVVQSCIHCHQIGEAKRNLILSREGTLPEAVLFPFPHPKVVGLVLDPKERAAVLSVAAESAAARAGFQTGDRILKLRGEPLLSIADVQWVLEQTPAEGGEIAAEVLRDGTVVALKLSLAPGWRKRDDISWRVSTWSLRRAALGGIHFMDLTEEERQKLQIPSGSLGLIVQHVGKYPPHDVAHKAGVQKGDVLVEYNSRTDLTSETEIIADRLLQVPDQEEIRLTFLRGGKRETILFSLPIVK